MSKRTEQIAELLMRTIGDIILNEISDPRISGIVTITGAKVSADLSFAIVYFSVLGDEKTWEAAKTALDKANGFIRKLAAERIIIKIMPKITFVADHTMENATKIEQILDAISAPQDDTNVNKRDND